MSIKADYKKYAKYLPVIVQNWRPVNGQTQELSEARLAHFKDYFEVDAPTEKAVENIVAKWHQTNTDGFALIQAELGLFEHQSHFCDYLAYLSFLHTDFSIELYTGDNKKFNLIQSHWQRLIDEVGAQNTEYQKQDLSLELNIWHELIAILQERGAASEFLDLLPRELEALINDIERGLEYFDAPFARTQVEHEEIRVLLGRSTNDYFEALKKHGLKTITDI